MRICRFFHSSLRLSFPRNFQRNRNAPSLMKPFDRSEIKEKVQSLYASDWETVFESSKSPIVDDVNVVDTIETKLPSRLDNDNIAEFLKDESGLDVEVFMKPDDSDQMIILELDSARTRLAIGEALIRRYKGHFEGHHVGREGLDADSDWAVIDLGSTIVHLMDPEARKAYNVEDAWRREVSAEESSEILSSNLKRRSDKKF